MRSPLVSIRGDKNTLIAFNAALSRKHEIEKFTHVAVRHDPATRTAEFVLSNNELAHGGSYTLGFDGGTGKKKGSPSRAFNVPRERVPFLRKGAYLANARKSRSSLVVTIELDKPVA